MRKIYLIIIIFSMLLLHVTFTPILVHKYIQKQHEPIYIQATDSTITYQAIDD